MTARAASKLKSGEPPEFRLNLALTTRAARDVLGLASGANGSSQAGPLSDSDARQEAATALSRWVGARTIYDVYLRNGGRGDDDGELVIELRLASDTGAEPNAALAARLDGKSLLIVGTEREDRRGGDSQFLVFNVRAIPEVWARKDAWSSLARVMFADEGGIPPRVLRAVASLPEARGQRETMQGRLADWRRYLGVLERTAKARQFSVAYKSFRRASNGSLVTFQLDPAYAEGIPWDKLRSVVDEPLEVRARAAAGRPGDEDDSDDWLLGYAARSDSDRNELTVALDEDTERLLERRSLELPRAATLHYKAAGDLAQIRRLKFGLELLEQGQGENPRLGEFLFDSAQAHLPDPARHASVARQHLLQPALNDGQLAAVEGALNAPDLFLIQGPPGTGKTTVIAEICYQNALRGQRTLIASQSNLAVDHALSRLVHHASIRALRRGRADRVEVEGAPFLEERVVGTWLDKTAAGCEADLAARRQRIRLFEDLLENRPRVEALAAALETYHAQRPGLEAQLAGEQAKVSPLRRQREQAQQVLARRADAAASLADLRQRFEAGETPEPGAAGGDALAQQMQWFDHQALQQLRANLDELNTALAAWQAAPVMLDEQDGPPGVMDTLELAQLARQRSAELVNRLSMMRSALDELHAAASDWLRDQANLETRIADHEALAGAQAAAGERRLALDAQHASLAAKAEALAAFDLQPQAVRQGLQNWLAGFSGRRASGALSRPPAEFSSRVGQEVWAIAAEEARLHKLAALALELNRSRVAADQLRILARQLTSAADAVQTDLPPSAAPDLRQPHQPRRASHWRASPLRGLAAFDAHGAMHPASHAGQVWIEAEAQIQALRAEPAGWASFLGRRQARLRALAEWGQWLRSAADDFTAHCAEWDGLVSHYAARLQERTAAVAPAFETAAANAARALGPANDQQLAEVVAALAVLDSTVPALARQFSDAEQSLNSLAALQDERQAQIQAGLDAMGTARATRHFRHLLKQVGAMPMENWESEWRAACGGFDNAVKLLLDVRADVDPLATLAELEQDLAQETARAEQRLEQARQDLRASERAAADAARALELLDAQQTAELDWWRAVNSALPESLRPAATGEPVESPAYVQAVLALNAQWDAALQHERDYLARAEALVLDWARRLRAADERDRADLKQIYIDNANVIGITCVQAGAYQFSRAYRNFDCVIIDEVSKATPPELLLPMLKGARIVLVGDHRQLPPMVGPETIADLADELDVGPNELAHLERSLFKELFLGAPPTLRVMLTQQYRMHPQIMQAINQFYDEQLVSGIDNPDRARAHGYDRPWLRPNNHLVWINTPTEGPFVEQRIGTTFMNPGEVDVIERLLKELDAAWQGRAPKDVGVITFYGAQVRALKDRLLNRPAGQAFKNLKLRVGTVDRFQGMERPIIIASLVRNNDRGSVGFARKPERVNVAFSRAQELLVIVGSRELFCQRARDGQATAIYGRVAEVVQQAGGLRRTVDVADNYKR